MPDNRYELPTDARIIDEELRAVAEQRNYLPHPICPVCGEKYGFDSEGRPYHFGCAHGGDHDVCDPDDAHIPR